MKTQKTYFDLLEDLCNHFLQKWGKDEKSIGNLSPGEPFYKIYPLKFKNEIFPDKNYALGFARKPFPCPWKTKSDPWKTESDPWNTERDPFIKEVQRFGFWGCTPKGWHEESPLLEITTEKRVKSLNDSTKGFRYRLRIEFHHAGRYFLNHKTKARDLFMIFIKKAYEMMKSEEYADSSPYEEAVPA